MTTVTRSSGRSENFNLVLAGEFRMFEVPAISLDGEYNFHVGTRIEYRLRGVTRTHRVISQHLLMKLRESTRLAHIHVDPIILQSTFIVNEICHYNIMTIV